MKNSNVLLTFTILIRLSSDRSLFPCIKFDYLGEMHFYFLRKVKFALKVGWLVASYEGPRTRYDVFGLPNFEG